MDGDPLTVGLDYLPAVTHAPGPGRYARELVRALVPLEDAPRLALFEVGGGRRLPAERLGLADAPPGRVRRLRARLPRRGLELWCRLARTGADRLLGGVDLFHRVRPDHPPLAGAPEVLPLAELPPAGTPADGALGTVARRAAAVLVFCRAYADEVARRYDLDPARVHRVPVGAEHFARDLVAAPEPTARPLLVVLGAVRSARAPGAVLAALERLRAGGVPAGLVWVGRPGDAAAELALALERAPVAGAVRWVREPVDAELPALLARAAALVHLAQDEGSAVTPLEALALGTPVVTSRLPAFEEALGNAAHWVPATRGGDDAALVEAVAEAAARALAESGDGARRAARRAHASPYTWHANARATLSVWHHVRAQGSAGAHRDGPPA